LQRSWPSYDANPPPVSHVDEKSAERYVKFIATHSTPKAMSLAEIQQATKADKTLQKLTELIRTNKWETIEVDPDMPDVDVSELKLFRRVREELSVSETDDFILRELGLSSPVHYVSEHWHLPTKDIKALSRRSNCFVKRFGFQKLTRKWRVC